MYISWRSPFCLTPLCGPFSPRSRPKHLRGGARANAEAVIGVRLANDVIPVVDRRATGARGSANETPLRSRARSEGSTRSRRRSEEHTSELQSPCNLVCRLLLEKKKQKHTVSTVGYNNMCD